MHESDLPTQCASITNLSSASFRCLMSSNLLRLHRHTSNHIVVMVCMQPHPGSLCTSPLAGLLVQLDAFIKEGLACVHPLLLALSHLPPHLVGVLLPALSCNKLLLLLTLDGLLLGPAGHVHTQGRTNKRQQIRSVVKATSKAASSHLSILSNCVLSLWACTARKCSLCMIWSSRAFFSMSSVVALHTHTQRPHDWLLCATHQRLVELRRLGIHSARCTHSLVSRASPHPPLYGYYAIAEGRGWRARLGIHSARCTHQPGHNLPLRL